MDFWSGLLVAGTLLSRLTTGVDSNSNHRLTAWPPWLLGNNQFVTTPSITTRQPAPSTDPSVSPQPFFVHPMNRRVGLVAPSWQQASPPWMAVPKPKTQQAPRQSPSFFERLFAFLPTVLNFFSGNSSNAQSRLPFDDIFRMLGFDSSGIGVFAMNLLVYLSEKLANRFFPNLDTNDIESRSFGGKSGFHLFPSPEKITQITRALSDNHLTEKVISNMDVSYGNGTSCPQKLVCKIAPIVRGVQRYLFPPRNANYIGDDEPKSSWLNRLYSEWPSLSEFQSSSNDCDQRFPQCGGY